MSTSKNLEVGLDGTKCNTVYSSNFHPVLFVYSVRNYRGFSGFRMSDERYTAYPQEQEYLLQEGFRVYALDVENDFVINNTH